MDNEHRKWLDKNLIEFTNDLDVIEVIPYLVATDRMLREHHVEKLRSLTKREAVGYLLETLKTRGPRAYQIFYEALLQSGQDHLAQLLECHLPVDYVRPAATTRPINHASRLLDTHANSPRSRSESPNEEGIGAVSSPIVTVIRQPSVDEVQMARQYYETHTPSLADGAFLAKVAPTKGVLSDLKVVMLPDSATGYAMTSYKIHFDESDMYHNFSQPKGLCLLFNNRDFVTMPHRAGTDVDAANMVRLFTQLGYHVKRKDNLSADQMYKALGRFALKQEHETCHSSVVIVLTHGEHGEVFGVDDRSLKVDDMLKMLSAHSCPALRGKPKLFFIQACRGTEFDKGHGDTVDARIREWTDMHDGHVPHNGVNDEPDPSWLNVMRIMSQAHSGQLTHEQQMAAIQNMDQVDAKQFLRKLPSDADYFIGYATTPGYVSWRNSAKGSWYIQAIVETFAKFAFREDLLGLMTKVNNIVSNSFASSDGGYKQVPEPTSRLTKKFYFFPGRSN